MIQGNVMIEWNASINTVLLFKGIYRLFRLRLWFILLLLIAIAIGVYVLAQTIPESAQQIQKFLQNPSVPFFISTVYAADGSSSSNFDPRPIVMLAIIGTLLLVLLISVGVMLTSNTPATVTASGDVTKVLLGFFVGVGTKYLGS
jgi:hypothetical protein